MAGVKANGKIIKATGGDGSVAYLGSRGIGEGGGLFFKDTPQGATKFYGGATGGIGYFLEQARAKWPRLTWTVENPPERPKGEPGACRAGRRADPLPPRGCRVLRSLRGL